MRIFFNGEPREVAEGTTVAELLQQLDMQPRYVAVEINLQLIPRQLHAQHVLNAEDRLEVVTLVGGG
jgi:thiamine biosynthesis protein ThiS